MNEREHGRARGMRIIKTVVFLFLGALPLSVAAGDKPIWTWHEPTTELYGPSFPKAGGELTIVRKRHIPDGHEAEELPEAELGKRLAPIHKDERFADPEVIILAIGGKTVTRVDWGWSPAFSPDGRQIAYAFQKKPISRFRVLAETMAGNEIRLYRRDTKTITTLATPDSGFLADPIFTPDGQRIVYSMGDAINGAWGGNVGLGRVSIDGSGNEIIYPPLKDFGLFHLIDPKQYVGDRLLVIRSKPTSGGAYLAASYDHELLDVGPPAKPVYAWGSHGRERPSSFGVDARGHVVVYDKGWRKVGADVQSRAGQTGSGSSGVVAPDGRRIAGIGPSGVTITDFQTNKALVALEIGGEIQTVVWSPDSRRLAVLSTKYKRGSDEIFDYDEVAIYQP